MEEFRKNVELIGWKGEVYYFLIGKSFKYVFEGVKVIDEDRIREFLEGLE